MLLDLQDRAVHQSEPDLDAPAPERGKLMGTLDALNTRYGRGSIQLASVRRGKVRSDLGDGAGIEDPDDTTCRKNFPRARA